MLFSGLGCSAPDANLGRIFDEDDPPRDLQGPDLPETLDSYTDRPTLPHFLLLTSVDNTPLGNPTTDVGARLGRVLFYDRWLGQDHNRSCGDCHQQAQGFTSKGLIEVQVGGERVSRSSMPLTNLRWVASRRVGEPDGESGFFWDGRADSLEEAVRESIRATWSINAGPHLEERLSKIWYYEELFRAAFGDSTITEDRVVFALAQFVRAMVSDRAELDQSLARIDWSGGSAAIESLSDILSDADLRDGLDVYLHDGKCASCHGDLVTLYGRTFANNGLELRYDDSGLAALTGNASDEGVFRVPNLRNVTLRSQLMHDGRFSSPQEALEHYVSGVKAHANLSDPLEAGNGIGEDRGKGLLRLLDALQDRELFEDAKFSNPFAARDG
jgi:cytochrome c peroxidase